MEESIKNRIILILAILSVIFFTGTIRSCGIDKRLKSTLTELDKQKAVSWDSEQKMNELKRDKAALENELAGVRTENEDTRKTLIQEQSVTKGLKEELEKMTQLKDKLEENLKEALVKNKSKSAR